MIWNLWPKDGLCSNRNNFKSSISKYPALGDTIYEQDQVYTKSNSDISDLSHINDENQIYHEKIWKSRTSSQTSINDERNEK